MNDGKKSFLSVRDFYQSEKHLLGLSPVLGKLSFSKKISLSSKNCDTGIIQVWGQKQLDKFEQLSAATQNDVLKQSWENAVCVILTKDHVVPLLMKREAKKRKIALFTSPFSVQTIRKKVKEFLATVAAEGVLIPGGLLRIFGMGVLIIGDSGVGKSECALELISRGCQFVSDDATLVKKQGEKLMGSAPHLSQDFMEVRGLGIINIHKIFGSRSICQKKSIDLVIHLQLWEEGRNYDTLGLKFPADFEILGEKIPHIIIPIAPGRNISTLIEVACKVYLCRLDGYHAPEDLLKRLDDALTPKSALSGRGHER